MSVCWLHFCSLYTSAKTNGERLLTPRPGKAHLQALAVTSLNTDEKRDNPIFHKVSLPAIPLILLSRTSKLRGNEAPPGNNVKKTFWKSLGRCWCILTASLLHMHEAASDVLTKFLTAASGSPSHKSPYVPKPPESTTLATMSETTSGLNHPAKLIPESSDT